MVDGTDIQLENGFVRIHPAILELLAQQPLSGREFRCLMFLFRKTYGYQKKEDRISLSQWGEGTGIPRTRVGAVLAGLVAKNIIIKTDNGANRPATWGFNKRFETWRNDQTVTLEGDSLEPENDQTVTLEGYKTVTLEGDSFSATVPLEGYKTVTLQGDNKRKKKGDTRIGDYFGMKRPVRAERITADGYTQDAAKEGVSPQTFRGIFDALIDAAGWRRLVDVGDDTKLNYAKRDALLLIRMGTRTVEQTRALIDAYRAAYQWRKSPPESRYIAEYASQLAGRDESPPSSVAATPNGVVSGFDLGQILEE